MFFDSKKIDCVVLQLLIMKDVSSASLQHIYTLSLEMR
jgi:hypothetical protein